MHGLILKFAELYCQAVSQDTHRWAADIVTQAFQQVMGRNPTPAELQIVMAVSDLETSYGKGWGHGRSTSGVGSHNWGAVQTRSGPSFTHEDSSAEGKYITKFKAYPDDISGAADVVRILFKGSRKQHEPDPKRSQRALGPEISGPNRGELIEAAAQQGDTLAFSKAMWYTSYFEGIASEFTKRILDHANGIQKRIDSISSALGQPSAWSIKSNNFLPVTNDQSVINRIMNMNSNVGAEQSLSNLTEQSLSNLTDQDFNTMLQKVWFE